jgi:plastocyanin
MKKFLVVLGLLMALSMALAACGGSSAATSNTAKVTMTDFAFDPATITVSAGKEVNITLVNDGNVDHNFVVMSKPVSDTFTDADKANVVWQKDVAKGQTVTDKFTAPAEGEYQVVCAIPGHVESGMVAKLVVTK